MAATGRVPNTAGLGLEAAGVELGRRARSWWMPVRKVGTSIYAVGGDRPHRPDARGDCRGAPLHRYPVWRRPTVSHDNVPSAVAATPNRLGRDERGTVQAFGEITNKQIQCDEEYVVRSFEKTFMKLIVEAASDGVVGRICWGRMPARSCRASAWPWWQARQRRFRRLLGIHPTAAEEFVTMRTPRGGSCAFTCVEPPNTCKIRIFQHYVWPVTGCFCRCSYK